MRSKLRYTHKAYCMLTTQSEAMTFY